MCIFFVYINNDASEGEYQLILASNRDEFYNRPTLPATRWPHDQQCISGVDQESGRVGGTWLGISERGKIAFLLNVAKPEGPDKSKKGRGSLVSDYLSGDVVARDYTSQLAPDRHIYNAFHLILLERKENRWAVDYLGSDDEHSPRTLNPGILSWGNSTVDQEWKKVADGRAEFGEIINSHKSCSERTGLVERLMTLINDQNPHLPDPALESIQGGRGEVVVKALSGIFVNLSFANYGTRTNTIILVDHEGRGEMIERTMTEPINPKQPTWATQTIPFTIGDLAKL